MKASVSTTPPAMTAQVPLSNPNTECAKFPTLAAMQARFAGSVLRHQNGTSSTAQGTGEGMTESPESEKTETTPSPTARLSPAPHRPEEDMHTEPDNNASGDTPSPGPLAARDREIMPARPPGRHTQETPSAWRNHRGHTTCTTARPRTTRQAPPRRTSTTSAPTGGLPPHGATNIRVRQLQALLRPGQRTTDHLFDVWIWCFNHDEPDQGRICVPHLAWAQTLISPPTEPRPAPSLGGWRQSAPQLSADVLNIPPYNGLAYWESRTSPERGHNLRAMMERYAQMVGPEAHAEPPVRGSPSTVAMVVLEKGHYYQVRITPGPLEHRWDLGAAHSMLPTDMRHPDGPTPLLPGQPHDPLTAIVSGRASAWHPGAPSTACGSGLNGGGSPPNSGQGHGGSTWMACNRWRSSGPTAGRTPPITESLCSVSAIHQIRALAAGQVSPAIDTEQEARAPHAALVGKLFAALRTTLVRHPCNPENC